MKARDIPGFCYLLMDAENDIMKICSNSIEKWKGGRNEK